MDVFTNLQSFKSRNYEQALKEAFYKVDEMVEKEDYGLDTGTTACVVFFDES